jgi:hypothetical protein
LAIWPIRSAVAGEQDHLGGHLQHIRRKILQVAAGELDAAQHVVVGELGAGSAGFFVAHQVANVVHQGADQRRVDMIIVQTLPRQVHAVQHARGAQHHFVGVGAVVVQGLELLVARQFAVESPVQQGKGRIDPRQVVAWSKAADDGVHLGFHLFGIADVA